MVFFQTTLYILSGCIRLNEESISVVWYSAVIMSPNIKIKFKGRLGVWLLIVSRLSNSRCITYSIYLWIIKFMLFIMSHLKEKKKTLSITAKSQIDPQGAKDTPMTHRQKRLQSFQQYLFMCVTEQQATTNQYSDAIQQYAWTVHIANTRFFLGSL